MSSGANATGSAYLDDVFVYNAGERVLGTTTPLYTLLLAALWGASFLFIAEALDTLEPGLITWIRVALGAGTLWLVPVAIT